MFKRTSLLAIATALTIGAALVAGTPALAADCNLVGSGLEGPTDTSLYQAPPAQLNASMIFVDFPDGPSSLGEEPPNGMTCDPGRRTASAASE